MKKLLVHISIISLAVVGMSGAVAALTPSDAEARSSYRSKTYKTWGQCNHARYSYMSSWTSAGKCDAIATKSGHVYGYSFRVYTRY